MKAGGKPYPDLVDLVLPLHDKYWKTEEAMAEGNPVLALERGEQVELPAGALHTRHQRQSPFPGLTLTVLSNTTRTAGGQVALELYEGEAEGFIIRNPSSSASEQALEKIITFVHAQLR